MKVAEPQNGENIEQRAGGLSPGAGELRPRAEKVPRAERVSFRVDLSENVGLREFWVFSRWVAWMPRLGRQARRAPPAPLQIFPLTLFSRLQRFFTFQWMEIFLG